MTSSVSYDQFDFLPASPAAHPPSAANVCCSCVIGNPGPPGKPGFPGDPGRVSGSLTNNIFLHLLCMVQVISAVENKTENEGIF